MRLHTLLDRLASTDTRVIFVPGVGAYPIETGLCREPDLTGMILRVVRQDREERQRRG